MPSRNDDDDDDYQQEAESYKQQGNTYFNLKQYTDAIQQYSQGIVSIDRITTKIIPQNTTTTTSSSAALDNNNNNNTNSVVQILKWTLLSNRALARIKEYETTTVTVVTSSSTTLDENNRMVTDDTTAAVTLLKDAIDDCQTAITAMSHSSSSSSNSSSISTDTKTLRAKLLYRSAQARFLLSNHHHYNNNSISNTTTTTTTSNNGFLLLQDAAQDLLLLLQMDPQHIEGKKLLNILRTQHQQQQKSSFSNTPVGKILSTLLDNHSMTTTDTCSDSTTTSIQQQQQQMKLLYNLIQNDPITTSMEIGRYTYNNDNNKNNNGLDLLWSIIVSGIENTIIDNNNTTSTSNKTNTTTVDTIIMKDHHVSLLGIQCIRSIASQYPIFVRTYMSLYQTSITNVSEMIVNQLLLLLLQQEKQQQEMIITTTKLYCDIMISILSIWHSIILHTDRDTQHPTRSTTSRNNNKNNNSNKNDNSDSDINNISGTTKLQYLQILSTLSYALQMGQYCYSQQQQQSLVNTTQSTLLYRAVMDIISVFIASTDRDHRIRMSLLNNNNNSDSKSSSSNNSNLYKMDPELEHIYTPPEIRNFTPIQLSAYKKRQYDIKTRNEAWAYERSKYICCTTVDVGSKNEIGGEGCDDNKNDDNTKTNITLLQQLLNIAVSYNDPNDMIFRREMTITISKIFSCLEPDTIIHDIVRPYLQDQQNNAASIKDEPYIEEIYNDDGDEKVENNTVVEEITSSASGNNNNVVTLETKMIRAVITTAILLLSSKKECATWVLSDDGWRDVSTDLSDLISSQRIVALCYVVELIQAAAVLEATRGMVTNWIQSGSMMEQLLQSKHRDVRSGAAAAIAKLGLSDKVTSKDDGELMGLLQAACELFEDRDDKLENHHRDSEAKNSTDTNNFNQYSSYATSSVERAVEMITYLVAHTTIKDEIAAGFGGSSGIPVLELLVQAADQPGAGESMSGYSLASIFQLLAATNEQMRREAFEGKEVTMEQYDEMQRMGKTEEEKEIMDTEKDTDTKAACQERIRKMANANVPRALIALTENASESTLEQLTMAMNRMADEASVRGIMIQQGVLSTCIKIEKAEGPTETDIMKKVIRTARHCIAKMLITTNPSLLTSAQKLGAVKPLILLIRDIRGSDLQHFEALLAITNIGSSGDDAKNRIVSERGISTLHFAMFSDHEMVRRAATEALCNLVPHEKMMEHLGEVDHLRLWLAFAVDYEDHYECARAAAGCLAMATQDETIAQALVNLEKFRIQMTSLLESGRLELMHRGFVVVYNLVLHGSKIKEATIAAGLIAFCRAYIELQQHSVSSDEFSAEERNLIPVTVEIAKQIVLSEDE